MRVRARVDIMLPLCAPAHRAGESQRDRDP